MANNASTQKALSKLLKQQKEFPISILEWQGMKSSMPLTAIPVGGLSYSLNMDFVDVNTLQSRGGTREWNPATLAGNNAIVGAFEYSVSGSSTSTGLKATANGKLYSFSTTIIGADVLIGDLTTSVTLRRVSFAQLIDKVYIADGESAWVWDPSSGLAAINKVATLGIGASDKVIAVLEHHKRIWFLCNKGLIVASAVNDPTDFTSVNAWDGIVGRGDGMENSNFISWYDDLLISKESSTTKRSAMYRMTGTTPVDYSINSLYSDKNTPTGFLGSSAAVVGNNVMGLTRGGFTTASAIETFSEVNISTESRDIRDWIRRINFNRSDLFVGIYDELTEQYMCACPIDQADYTNVIFIFDIANNRWGLYDGWAVSTFFKMGGRVFYGSRNGQIIQTGYGYNDMGSGYRKIVETGNIHLDSPDTIKLFKQMEVDILQNGSYNVNVTPVVDDQDLSATVIPVSITGGSSWDVFMWDRDPFDVLPGTRTTLYLLLRGKMLRLRFSNTNADEPYALRTLTLRTLKTDAGAMQLPS